MMSHRRHGGPPSQLSASSCGANHDRRQRLTTTFLDGKRQARALRQSDLATSTAAENAVMHRRQHRRRTGLNPLLRVMNLSDIFDVYEANKQRLHHNVNQWSDQENMHRKPLGELDLNHQSTAAGSEDNRFAPVLGRPGGGCLLSNTTSCSQL